VRLGVVRPAVVERVAARAPAAAALRHRSLCAGVLACWRAGVLACSASNVLAVRFGGRQSSVVNSQEKKHDIIDLDLIDLYARASFF
jgi:hypothetical protein